MPRIKKLKLDEWDKDLREMTAADSGTALEQGIMRMFAHTPEISKGLVAFGGAIKPADRLMHGKTSMILHDGKEIFSDLPNPFEATRYHSLIVDAESLPDCLELTAKTEEGEIMGMRHRELPIEGVQFHPESILTRMGMDLLRNFVDRGVV